MRQKEKDQLEQKTERRHWFRRFAAGCKAIRTHKWKAVVPAGYLLAVLVLWLCREQVFPIPGSSPLAPLCRGILQLLFPVYAAGGLFFLLAALGSPIGGKAMRENLWRIGLCNHAGEAPLLVARYRDKENPRVTVLEFETNGIPRTEWEDRQSKIEAALNRTVVKIAQGADNRRVLLYTVSASALPSVLHWKDRYLRKDSFVLVLGENPLGQVTVDLTRVPHILLGGSTGSGKSVLLKLLLMQCVKKGARVYIADFKGGVDFPDIWHAKCRIVTDAQTLLHTLASLADELERRKRLFREAGCASMDEYNRKTGSSLLRLVLACDEAAEVLDKTGLSKEDKELVTQIESRLSLIARQGRAFGIHLILATQRPDATILPGQIRSNIDCRICGRADNVLSQIILDNTSATERIPKDAQGRFITGDGSLFQAYWFDENAALADTDEI